MSKRIKVLSFDLDDTLWPCLPTIERAEEELFQWLSAHVSVITQQYTRQQLREKRLLLLEQHSELAHNLTKLRILSFKQLVSEFKTTDSWIQPAFEVFHHARQQVTLFEDVAPTLDALSVDYRLVSVTNGNANTILTGVDHWFDFSLNSESVGKQKSEPDIYRHVQKLTQVDARQMVHIGDHPLQDVSGAKSAGVFAIWLNRQQESWELAGCEPDATIVSLAELPAVLERLA